MVTGRHTGLLRFVNPGESKILTENLEHLPEVGGTAPNFKPVTETTKTESPGREVRQDTRVKLGIRYDIMVVYNK